MEEIFSLFSTSFSLMYSFHLSFSDILYFACSLSSFFNLPAPGLCGSSYTERNSTYVMSYMEDMEELGETEVDLSSSFLSPSLPNWRPERLAFMSVCLRFPS